MPANPQVTEEMVEKAAEALASCVHPGRATSPNYWSDWVSSMDKDGFRNEARAALTAALADHGEGWRDIKSAPKDRTDIILYYPLEGLSDNFDKIIIGYWRQATDTYGHWVWQSRAVRGYSDECQPTHWMPLPASPLVSQEG